MSKDNNRSIENTQEQALNRCQKRLSLVSTLDSCLSTIQGCELKFSNFMHNVTVKSAIDGKNELQNKSEEELQGVNFSAMDAVEQIILKMKESGVHLEDEFYNLPLADIEQNIIHLRDKLAQQNNEFILGRDTL